MTAVETGTSPVVTDELVLTTESHHAGGGFDARARLGECRQFDRTGTPTVPGPGS